MLKFSSSSDRHEKEINEYQLLWWRTHLSYSSMRGFIFSKPIPPWYTLATAEKIIHCLLHLAWYSAQTLPGSEPYNMNHLNSRNMRMMIMKNRHGFWWKKKKRKQCSGPWFAILSVWLSLNAAWCERVSPHFFLMIITSVCYSETEISWTDAIYW